MLGYMLTGVLAGLMSGLLGLGGGIIVVPALALLFLSNPAIPPALHMQMAIGTSLAIMIITLMASVYAHHRRRMIQWSMVKIILPGLLLGIVMGASSISFLPASVLSRFFGVFLLTLVLQIVFFGYKQRKYESEYPISPWIIRSVSLLIGVLSSLLGVGGGVLWVPFFLRCQLAMHAAVGTSAACGMIAAGFATLLFMVGHRLMDVSIPYSTGYIYWPAFLGVAITSVIVAPLGVILAYRLSSRWLSYIFALLLLAMAIQMIFFVH